MGTPTPEATKLCHALKSAGFRAKLELHDGFKHIDIAVPEVMINIEVDGYQHNLDARQALSDLQRTYHSLKKGYFTVRLPNSLIRTHFDQAVDLVIGILNESEKQLSEEEY